MINEQFTKSVKVGEPGQPRDRWAFLRHVTALARSHMNGLKLFGRTTEQTTETMLPSPKTITAAAMTTNRITSLRGLLHYRGPLQAETFHIRETSIATMGNKSVETLGSKIRFLSILVTFPPFRPKQC